MERDSKYFGGNREKAIICDNERYRNCGLSRQESYKKHGKDLYVLHIGSRRDSYIENLITLCQKCFNATMFKKKSRVNN